MTRLQEFAKMIIEIEKADMWDAHPEYFERLCYWYDIDAHDYTEPEDLFRAIVDAYKEEVQHDNNI